MIKYLIKLDKYDTYTKLTSKFMLCVQKIELIRENSNIAMI